MADGDHYFSLLPHRNNGYDLNSKIMLTAIVSLSVVVLLVVALHLYARFVLRRRAHLRRQGFLGGIRSIGLTPRGEQQLPPKTGLDPMVINSLPIFAFKQPNDVSHYNEKGFATECAVCLSMLEEEEMVRLLPNCKHTFHAECIDKWLTSRSTCPICRMEAKPCRLLPEPREGPIMENIDSASSIAESHLRRERVDFMEGTSEIGGAQLSPSAKVNNGSSSRMSSFRRILSRERSMRRVQSCELDDQDSLQDLERQ